MNIEVLKKDASEEVIAYFSKLLVNFSGKDIEIAVVESFSNFSYKLMSYDTSLTIEKSHLVNHFIFLDSKMMSSEQYLKGQSFFKSSVGCLGVIDMAQDYSMYLAFFDSFVGQINIIDSQKGILKKLNSTIESILAQLKRVKSFHEKIVPIRNENFRGININSRFCAGTASGGEYFDFFKSNQSLWLFSINASSYITIGSFLSIVDNWKEYGSNLDFKIIEKELNASSEEFKSFGEVSLLVLRVDLHTLEVDCLNVGGHEILDNEKIIISRNSNSFQDCVIESQLTQFSLVRGSQLVILSPGYFNNTGDKIDEGSTFNFLKKNTLSNENLVQELTFQSKRKYGDLDFMPFDQTIFVIGVEKNVISKA